MIRKIDDTMGSDYLILRTGEEEIVPPDYLCIGSRHDDVLINRHEARLFAAILLHFADTGELPGEVGDGLA